MNFDNRDNVGVTILPNGEKVIDISHLGFFAACKRSITEGLKGNRVTYDPSAYASRGKTVLNECMGGCGGETKRVETPTVAIPPRPSDGMPPHSSIADAPSAKRESVAPTRTVEVDDWSKPHIPDFFTASKHAALRNIYYQMLEKGEYILAASETMQEHVLFNEVGIVVMTNRRVMCIYQWSHEAFDLKSVEATKVSYLGLIFKRACLDFYCKRNKIWSYDYCKQEDEVQRMVRYVRYLRERQ